MITRSEAIKRLGSDNVIGKTLSVISRGKTRDFKIVGVLADIRKNSHFKATVIARLDMGEFNADFPNSLTCWGCQNGYSYIKLRPDRSPSDRDGPSGMGKAEHS